MLEKYLLHCQIVKPYSSKVFFNSIHRKSQYFVKYVRNCSHRSLTFMGCLQIMLAYSINFIKNVRIVFYGGLIKNYILFIWCKNTKTFSDTTRRFRYFIFMFILKVSCDKFFNYKHHSTYNISLFREL